MTVATICLSSSVLSDHLSRLYVDPAPGDNTYAHVDREGAVVRVIRNTRTTAVAEFTDEALADILDDLDYQIEFSQGAYRSACRRAHATIIAQTT